MMFDDDAVELDEWFYEELFKYLERGAESIEVRTIDGSSSTGAIDTYGVIAPGQIATWVDDPAAVAQEVRRQTAAGKGVSQTFFGVAPRSARPNDRNLITSVLAVHAHVPIGRLTTVKGAIVMLRSATPTPTAVIASPLAVDAYWFLDRRYDDENMVRAGIISNLVADLCGVDRRVATPCRLLQAPGGLQSCKAVSGYAGFMMPWFHPERRYSLLDLSDIRILSSGVSVSFDEDLSAFDTEPPKTH